MAKGKKQEIGKRTPNKRPDLQEFLDAVVENWTPWR